MAQLVEGLWDCPYCGRKGIGGLTKKCPECGHPQDKGTKFYVGKTPKALSREQSEKVGTDADWVCAYCESYNNARNTECINCGAPREEKQGDYFSTGQSPEISTKQSRSKQTKSGKKTPENAGKDIRTAQKLDLQERFGILGAILNIPIRIISFFLRILRTFFGIIGGIFSDIFWEHPIMYSFMAISFVVLMLIVMVMGAPVKHNGVVREMTWERTIDVEEYSTVRESDWSVPEGGRLVTSKREVRSYRQVLDHYTTVSVEVPYSVSDGYDTEYRDNGNGTFSAVQTPRYRTEYRTETRSEPVYRNEPVYDTKYYYDIEKWHNVRTEQSSGTEQEEPFWPEVQYADNQREQMRNEEYTVHFYDPKKDETYPYTCTRSEWETFSIGMSATFITEFGVVVEIKSGGG